MELVIERATAADAETLVRVQIAAFHSDAVLYPGVEASGPPGYDDVAVMLDKIARDECYKICAGEQCIGGMVIFDKGAGHYHLDVLFVDPAWHSRGVGSRAMLFLEQTYAAERWTLDTPQYALRNQHFYEKFGYVRGAAFEDEDGTRLFAYEKRRA